MRIITGTAKGKKRLAVPGDTTRPILDRVKVSLFSIIRPQLEGSYWLDLFAGSGAVGLEALSEGAAHCVFIDLNEAAYQTIKKNVELTKLAAHSEVRRSDAFSYLKHTNSSFDFIYIDPPQFNGLWERSLEFIAERPQLLKQDGLVIVKMHPKEWSKQEYSGLNLLRQEQYGNSLLSFFQKK
jgi:16S rRNA (guanine966-N2)-methyltransferase